MKLIVLLLTSILVENVILSKFLGLCPFVGASKDSSSSLKMGISLTLVMVTASIINYFLYYYVLKPFNMEYLKSIVFILIIALTVQVLSLIIKKTSPYFYEKLGIYLPLLTTNCAIFGTVLLSINTNYNLIETIINALGSGLGFILVITIFSSIKNRIDKAPVLNGFKGFPIAFITAGIMALIWTRYVFVI